MAKLVSLERVKDQRAREKRKRLVTALENLLARAKSGEISGVCFAAIPADRQSLCIAALHNDDCGFYELVGAATLMADHVVSAARASVDSD
jgi:hypothetical protein